MRWTKEDITTLRERYPFESKEVLEKLLRRKWETIKKKAWELGLERDTNWKKIIKERPVEWSKELLEELYWKKGYSIRDIARILGRDGKTIIQHMDSYGIPRRTSYQARYGRLSVNILTPEESAYLAGFLDGDGSITIYSNNRKNPKVIIRFFNTNLDVINWIKNKLGRNCYYRQYSGSSLSKKKQYQIAIQKSIDVYYLLKSMLPYLIVKKDIARKAIQILEERLKKYKIKIVL